MIEADVLIVGAGHAGAACAIALRQGKYEGRILVVGAEPNLPYERPPLSKDYFSGDKTFERLLIRPESFWVERGITFKLGATVDKVDAAGHTVMTSAGEVISYRHLVWATGGQPRRLACAGSDLAGVHTVRTRADADQIIARAAKAEQVVVIGGGYIGLEAAAVLSKAGKQVVLLEAQDRVLARAAGAPLSRFLEAEHRAHGVEVRLGAAVEAILGEDHVTGVRLADGQMLDAQLVIVGIGIIPAVAPLLAAGAAGGDGVEVNGFCRTSLPDIHAIGDCARHANPYADGARVRLESVQNANDQASVAAKAILDQPVAYEATPWFWSNQYDIKLQTVGLSLGHDEIIVRGDPADRSFSLAYLKAGRIIALDCVNSVKDYVHGRKLVVQGARPDRRRLSDPTIALKDLEPET